MTTTLEKTQLSFLADISGGVVAADDIPSEAAGLVTPPPTKLKEGWVSTEKYAEVYVSPGGIAWVVQRIGNKLESVSVKLPKADITEKSSAERTKNARRLAVWRKSQG
jgi:hypothetical protein